jgi:Leucine-rich repeat (LRR) protein
MGNRPGRTDQLKEEELAKTLCYTEISGNIQIKNHNFETIPKILVDHIQKHIQNLTLLELTMCKLTDHSFRQLLSSENPFPTLKRLNIEGNQLTKLDLNGNLLPNVEAVVAKNNRIEQLSLKAMASLKSLDLEANQLKTFLEPQEVLELTSLSSLYLPNNLLESIPKEIGTIFLLDDRLYTNIVLEISSSG